MPWPAPNAPADVQSAAPPPQDTTDIADAEKAQNLQLAQQLAQQAHAAQMLVRREQRRRHGALGEEAARSWYRRITDMTPEGTIDAYFRLFHGVDISPSRRHSLNAIREREEDNGHN